MPVIKVVVKVWCKPWAFKLLPKLRKRIVVVAKKLKLSSDYDITCRRLDNEIIIEVTGVFTISEDTKTPSYGYQPLAIAFVTAMEKMFPEMFIACSIYPFLPSLASWTNRR